MTVSPTATAGTAASAGAVCSRLVERAGTEADAGAGGGKRARGMLILMWVGSAGGGDAETARSVQQHQLQLPAPAAPRRWRRGGRRRQALRVEAGPHPLTGPARHRDRCIRT